MGLAPGKDNPNLSCLFCVSVDASYTYWSMSPLSSIRDRLGFQVICSSLRQLPRNTCWDSSQQCSLAESHSCRFGVKVLVLSPITGFSSTSGQGGWTGPEDHRAWKQKPLLFCTAAAYQPTAAISRSKVKSYNNTCIILKQYL